VTNALLLLLLVSCVLTQFIPTQYDTLKPQPYGALDIHWYKAVICSTQQYIGCTVNATANLPHDAWSYGDGRFIQFEVTSDIDGCQKILCKNNASLAPPIQSSCVFTFTQDLLKVQALYVKTVSGPSPDNTATVNLVFECGRRVETEQRQEQESFALTEKRETQQIGQCPTTVAILKEVIQLTTENRVITSPDYEDALKFYFFVCGDGVHRYRATALTLGSTIDSAFSTYICPTSPCFPVSSPYYDASGTGINTVVFQTSTPNPVEFYVTIYGWGKFRQWNYFRFGVNIEAMDGEIIADQ